MEIPEHKQWAKDMTQEEFSRIFPVKYPNADTIPNLAYWLTAPEPVYHGIPAINPEEIVLEGNGPIEVKKPDKLECEGCGKEFTAARNMKYAHKKKHQRECEAFLNKRGKGVDHALSS